MIITDKFVFIHFPKTGGTFVTKILQQIHENRGEPLLKRREGRAIPLTEKVRNWIIPARQQPILFKVLLNGVWSPHGQVQHIPPEHRHKPVLVTLRNPYDLYVSQFHFAWWREHPRWKVSVDEIKARYPGYPDNLTFEEFIQLRNTYSRIPSTPRFSEEDALGAETWQFVKFLYTDPDRFSEIDADYLAQKKYWSDMPTNIHFTFTNNLNQQLHDFLLQVGYGADEIAFILDHGKIRPKNSQRTDSQKWEAHYTPELKQWVRHRERMLFEMFPQFDI